MGIPFFLLILVVTGIIIITITMAYFFTYKRKINLILNNKEAPHTVLMSPHKVAIIVTILLLIMTTIASYFVGYKVAYDNFEYAALSSPSTFEIFFAEVIEQDSNYIVINGIEENEEKYREQFTLEIWPETNISWHGTNVTLSDIKPGQIISITLAAPTGTVDLTSETITDVFRIQILSD